MPPKGAQTEGLDGAHPSAAGLTDAALGQKVRRALGSAVPGAIKDPDGDWRPFMPVGRRVLLPGRGTTFVREVQGPPGAPTVVLLHGFMASAGLNWFRAFEELGREFHVLAPDLRGHARGLRSRRHVRLADCADDLAVMLEQLGTGPVIAAGYSMGGPVAQLLWRRHPERVKGLVFCATSARLSDTYGTEPLTDVYLAALSAVARTTDQLAAIPAAGARVLRRARANRPASFLEWAAAEFRRHDIRMLVESARTSARFDSTDWIGEVDVPTSVVMTTRDHLVRPDAQEQLVTAIDGAQLIELDAGHLACARPSFGEPMLRAVRNVANRAS